MDFIRDFVVGAYHSRMLGSIHEIPDHCLYYSHGAGSESPVLVHVDSVPAKNPETCRIISISDTHERHGSLGRLPAGDIFIHTGDILMSNSLRSKEHGMKTLHDFNQWLGTVPCTNRIVIAGNHDFTIERLGKDNTQRVLSNGIYLENSHIEVNNLLIWGTPASLGTSYNKAFQSSSFYGEATESLSRLPSSPDILLTHGSCKDIRSHLFPNSRHGPSMKLASHIHFWGHLHGHYGVKRSSNGVLSVCSCIMDGSYSLTNVPIVVDCCLYNNNKNVVQAE